MYRIFRSILFVSLLSLFSTLAWSTPIINGPIDFSGYKGKWVMIVYWATWCNICMEEVPQLNAFYRVHSKDVIMLGVNYDDGALAGLRQRIEESGILFPVLNYDPKQQWGVRHIQGLPTILLIGPHGRFIRELVGSQTQRDLEASVGL